MDKLPLLKSVIISSFSNMFRKAQMGYPISNYKDIREAMLAINMIDNFTVPSYKVTAIVEYYIRKLSNI